MDVLGRCYSMNPQAGRQAIYAFMEYAAAVPSIAQDLLFMVLRASAGYRDFVMGICLSVLSYIRVGSLELAFMVITRGVSQRCPSSGD
eukprot:6046218-Karenia_brevis.AAC.1